ncbi:hypothetical protein ACVI1J_004885 [Bradyrhizobium diazoefficiens]|uniref:hypothetical protein n=1 Tax=Bradyrhizobium diazoefficiens TaxID=1355477 RepID=UPI0038356F31
MGSPVATMLLPTLKLPLKFTVTPVVPPLSVKAPLPSAVPLPTTSVVPSLMVVPPL